MLIGNCLNEVVSGYTSIFCALNLTVNARKVYYFLIQIPLVTLAL